MKRGGGGAGGVEAWEYILSALHTLGTLIIS